MHTNAAPAFSAITPAQVIRVVFLTDEQGRVQIVLPADRLLDLNHLNATLQRNLVALAPEQHQQLALRGKLADFPQVSKNSLLSILVDGLLLNHDQLYLMSSDMQAEPVDMTQFLTLVSYADVGVFSQPLPSLSTDSEQDITRIHNALAQFTPLRIKQRLAETLNLPPLPEIANRIIELRTDPNSGPKDLAQTAELDAGLSAQILNWARSPYYGVMGEIKSIEDAVTRVLGFDLVINLALGLALGRALSVPKDGPHGYAPFWQQSVITAVLCNELIKTIPARLRPSLGLSYLCGLLHNFGFLILGHIFPPQAELVNRHIEANPEVNRSLLEQHLLGINREQIAATLLQQWHMPEEVVFAIRQQHNAKVTGPRAPYAQLLYVATRALRQQGFGDGPLEPIAAYVLDDLALNPQAVQEVTAAVLSRRDEFNSLARKLES